VSGVSTIVFGVRWWALATAVIGAAASDGSEAAAVEAEVSDLCMRQAEQVERSEGIPRGLLQAIALVETGRSGQVGELKDPWPWTVSAGASGRYLLTKAAAIDVVRQLRAEGVTSIDVGCMQINLRYHGDAFSSVGDALDPARNVAYAASFLRQLAEETGSWRLAAGYYHSHDPSRAADYLEKLDRIWQDLTPSQDNQLEAGRARALRPADVRELRRIVEDIRSAIIQLRGAVPRSDATPAESFSRSVASD
jgi:hypothetical protein